MWDATPVYMPIYFFERYATMYLELNDDDIRLIIKKHFKIELLEDVHCLENELGEKMFGFL